MSMESTSPSMEAEAETSSVQSMQDVQPSGSTHPTSTEQSSENSRPRARKGSGGASTSTVSTRKHRPPASVTPNACTNCKKARAKCHGGRPACKRCADRGVGNECHYEVHAKTAKEQMLREIQRLQKQTETLASENVSLEESHAWIEQIMQSLKENGNATEIIKKLKRGESHETIAKWLQQTKVGAFQPMSPATERKLGQAIEQFHRDFAENPNVLYWTSVAKVPTLVEHLIKLYLTWIHPVHMLFDQDRFLHSFQTCTDTYCSAPMVNIICAMACHLLHDSYGSDDVARASISSLRNQFLDETKFWLQKDLDYSKMTTIQTYAIMFLVELSCGHGLLAASHLRLAVENLFMRKSAEQTYEAEEIASWGIFTLHTVWSGFTFQKPSAPISRTALTFEKLVKEQAHDGPWHPYTTIPDEYGEEDQRPSHALETAAQHAKLFRIVHRNILIYCGSKGKVDAQELLELYERYLAWKEGLAPDMANLSGEPLPHVLFLHIQYHTTLVSLLQPLLHLRDFKGETYETLRQLVLDHARTGVRVIHQYQSIYSTYFLTPLQIFCMVHLCEALIRYDTADSHEPSASETVDFCLSSLERTCKSYPVAGVLQHMFQISLKEQGIPISDELERRTEASTRITPDELLDACTRPTYQQPLSQIISNMEPGLGQTFMDKWGELTRESAHKAKGKAPKQMDITSLLNR